MHFSMDNICTASRSFWAAFAVLFLCIPVCGQTILYKKWQVEDGLPQNSVNQIIQTKDGYLWLATHGGLVRFDGVKFKIFDISNTPELKSNRVMHIATDETGQLYINTSEGGL